MKRGDRRSTIIRKFRNGAKHATGSLLWKSVEKVLSFGTVQEKADELKLDNREEIYKLRNGEAGFDTYIRHNDGGRG